jgi:hypothetical protein
VTKLFKPLRGVAAALLLAALLLPGLAANHAAAANQFADPAFKAVWTRTDALVGQNGITRGYFWGPQPSFSLQEAYKEGAGGKRLVQYFDKSRMEINNPNADKSSKFYVTNGLLTVELISGRMQTGNNDYQYRWSAQIDLASDADDASAPTYASFQDLMYQADSRIGENATSTINRIGSVGNDISKASDPGTVIAYYEPATKHNIPKVFWDFLNQSGPVMDGGKQVNEKLNDPWFYATGYPITEPYWASVKIAGQANTAVLIQPYERRVLTYVPSAPAAYRVQMGNIGQHYYDWRYNNAGKPTFDPATCETVPTKGVGKVWADHPEVQTELGCPDRFSPYDVVVAQQQFEHGQMIDIIIRDTYNGKIYTYKTIYVLFDDGTVQQFDDQYQDGTDPGGHEVPPAPNLYAPKFGFGQVWREGTGAHVRERLGWATAQEVGSNGYYKEFSKGIALATNAPLKKIYILYNGNGYGGYNTNRWVVYDDTYNP